MARIFVGSSTPAETAAFKAVFVRLASVLHASQNVLAEALETTVPESPSDSARRKQLWDAYEQANLLLYSAEDHLRTILMLLEGAKIPTYSLYTLLRTAAMAVVRGAYLLDARLDEQMRLARGLNARWDNLKEQSKVDRNAALFAERVGQLEQRALSNGIEVLNKVPDRPGRHFGEHRRRDVELFAEYLTPIQESADDVGAPPFGETAFRFLSGHVHSMLWVKFLGAKPVSTDEAGMASVQLDLQIEWFAGLLSSVLRLHESNINRMLTLSGYPLMVWTEAMKSGVELAKVAYVRLAETQANSAKGA